MLESRVITMPIGRTWRETYDFLAAPANYALWAAGLGVLRQEGDRWRAETPYGVMEISFSPRNGFGIADHWVIPPDGGEIYIPFRVIANGEGCEIIFILFRQQGVTDAMFERDAAQVARDLSTLKELLERQA